MKLQISFDVSDLTNALDIAKKVEPYCDIFEVTTILIYKYGIHALQEFKKTFPQKTILADSKIVDRGRAATTLFNTTDVDWITVMAGTAKEVIHAAAATAHASNKKVMLDLLDSSSPEQSAMEAQGLNVDALLFHKPFDEKDSVTFLEKWDSVRGNTQLPIFIAAYMSSELVDKVIALKPDGIVVGSAITEAEDPTKAAEELYQLCNKS